MTSSPGSPYVVSRVELVFQTTPEIFQSVLQDLAAAGINIAGCFYGQDVDVGARLVVGGLSDTLSMARATQIIGRRITGPIQQNPVSEVLPVPGLRREMLAAFCYITLNETSGLVLPASYGSDTGSQFYSTVPFEAGAQALAQAVAAATGFK